MVEEATFRERLESRKNMPKDKISISVTRKNLAKFRGLLEKHFPDTNLSQAFDEMLVDGLEELKEFDEEEENE